jgi:predicted dehydrogenase
MAVVGLGQIAELVIPAYAARDDVEIVGLCDLDEHRVARWAGDIPAALHTTDLDTLLRTNPDLVEVLVPTPAHADVVCPILEAGFHVEVQKPLARDMEGADRMLAAARGSGAELGVLEDYLCFPPLVKLHEIVSSGEIGAPVGLHMKIVATGRGGWEVPIESYRWQFEQARDGRGMLVFDHGWHQLAIAVWLFGPVKKVFGWLGETEVAPGINLDAPSTLVWEHHNGVRAVLDISLAADTYFRSSHYSCDERVEVTGSRGYVRCNRISSFGVQEPSVVVYRDGEIRSFHALADLPPDAFAAMAQRSADYFTGRYPTPVMNGGTARHVLAALLAGIESAERGVPVEVVGPPPPSP